jgi:hypothetical protein
LFDGQLKIANVIYGALSNRLVSRSRADAQGTILILAKLMDQPITFAAAPENMLINPTLTSIVVVHRWTLLSFPPLASPDLRQRLSFVAAKVTLSKFFGLTKVPGRTDKLQCPHSSHDCHW